MDAQPQHIAWGAAWAAMMYVLGNAVWLNHLARQRRWLGWLMWLAAAGIVIVAGAAVDIRLAGGEGGVWQHLTGVDKENHWIALTLFAVMSVPGAASVLMRQSAFWTRIAFVIPAIVVFVPVGMQMDTGSGNGGNLFAGLGLALVVCALLLVWQYLLDPEAPAGRTKAAANIKTANIKTRGKPAA